MSTLRTQTVVIGAAFVAFAIANASALAQQKHLTPEQLMERLKTAAPPAIFEGATVVDMKEDGSMAVLRKGANGWSCMDPGGTAPMCADANAMEWLHALMSKGPAPQKLGFVNMLRGDNGAKHRPLCDRGEGRQQLGQDGFSRDDCRRRREGVTPNLSTQPEARSAQALCDVAGQPGRAPDVAGPVTA